MDELYMFLLPVRKYKFDDYTLIGALPPLIHDKNGMDFYVYALTNNKKYAKRFRKERDMTKFSVLILNTDIESKMDLYSGAALELIDYSDGNKSVELLSTSIEYDFTSDAKYTIFEKLTTDIDPRTMTFRMISLKEKYAEALHAIGVDDLAFSLENYFQGIESEDPIVEVSKFKIYCTVFSDLYKG